MRPAKLGGVSEAGTLARENRTDRQCCRARGRADRQQAGRQGRGSVIEEDLEDTPCVSAVSAPSCLVMRASVLLGVLHARV